MMTPKMILALALLSALPVQAKIEAMDRIERVLDSKFHQLPECDDMFLRGEDTALSHKRKSPQ